MTATAQPVPKAAARSVTALGLALFWSGVLVGWFSAGRVSVPEAVWQAGFILPAVGCVGLATIVAVSGHARKKLGLDAILGLLSLALGFFCVMVLLGYEGSHRGWWFFLAVGVILSASSVVLLGVVFVVSARRLVERGKERVMPVRKSEAIWRGTLKEGRGTMKLASGLYEGPYTFSSRFEEAAGTNPEELVGAAHAGCFSMFLAALLTEKGYAPERIYTTAAVHLGAGPTIKKIELECEATVPGVGEAEFQELAAAAKADCPVSKALAAVPEILLTARVAA